MRALWCAALAWVTLGCHDPTPKPVAAVPLSVAVAPQELPKPEPRVLPKTVEFPPCIDDAHTLKLDGLTQSEVEGRYGSPVTRESFRAEERQGEFYVGIENVYPSTVAANRDVPLQEWTWKNGDCNLTVWFHQKGGVWRAFADIYWHKGLDF